jgi:class 3 adenylate cyclase/tetratricopeptide (TPR) repeat protein
VNCPACGAENRDTARFCGECAAPLAPEVACPSCGSANPPGRKFCDECGAPLGVSGVGSRVSGKRTQAGIDTRDPTPDPRSYTPKHLANKILTSRSALEGERKQVTVLFADVKGSMELAGQLDPEEWHQILDRFFAILTEGVHRFEGTVNQYTGDGIMALFGAPITHEDHAQRACYAALHLREALKRYADELRRTAGVSLSVRIGLNSGDVVVGKIGDDLRMDYTAQGHTVGLAQRMEARAAADSAYLTEHTARLVQGYFELRDLGAFDLKGVSAPVTVYELTGVGALRSRLDRSRERGFSRFVGRTDELAVLESALNRSLEGRGGVVGVVAQAGVGKSRLCLEFVERCRARGVAVYEAHCPSHGKLVPLLPVLELFCGYFGITHKDGDQLAREKIAGRMLLLDRDLDPFLPLAFDFLGVPDPQRPAPTMDPAVRQRQLFAFTRRLIQARSVREPAVLFVDDAHWIDEGSDAFIAQVADIVPGTRTTLLLNFRPEYSAEWMARPSYQQLPLHPLGPEAIDELLADLLGADPSLARLPALMRERTGGNPFFIEEIVQSLVESGSLVGQRGAYRLDAPIERLEIPPTVHGILAARIDRLPEREKSVLQTAAAIGLKFPEPLLRRVCDLSADDLESAVAALRRAELIHEESLYPDVEYAFRHPLTHEVAERSQLAAQRRRVHVAVARALEELHADKPEENAALLAHHWDLGGEADPAARWYRRAAQWIAGSNSAEARRHWNRVRELAEQVGDAALALELGQQSRLMILEYGWRLGVSEAEADELLREGETWARRNNDPRALAALYNAFSMPCLFSLGNPQRARDVVQNGLRLAEQAGDAVLACALELRLFFISERLGLIPAMFSAMEAVLHHSPEDIEGATPLVGYNVPAAVAGFRGWPYVFAGQLDVGLDHIRRGIELARANGAVEVAGWLLGQESFAWCERGEMGRASGAARESLEIAERIESPLSQFLASQSFARALALEGDTCAALSALERARSSFERVDLTRESEILSDLALAHCALGALAEAHTLAERALDLAVKRGLLGVEVLALRALARVHLEHGTAASFAQAHRLLDRAELRAEGISYRLILPRLYELRADLARREGDVAAAEAALRAAQRLYQEMSAPLQVERLAKDLGS